MLQRLILAMVFLASAFLALGCSETDDPKATPSLTVAAESTATAATTPSAVATALPGSRPPGVNLNATPTMNYVPIPGSMAVTPTVYPPMTIRGAAETSWTPTVRRTGGGPGGGTPPAMGAIEGQLIYPSEGIPPGLVVCAESLDWGDTYCTNQRVDRPGNAAGSRGGYVLQLPAGRFLVFALSRLRRRASRRAACLLLLLRTLWPAHRLPQS
jgi:hypothetical protein